jgi:hypothetical protein
MTQPGDVKGQAEGAVGIAPDQASKRSLQQLVTDQRIKRAGLAELCCSANVVLQQLEHANMATDELEHQRAGSEREQRRDLRSPPASPQSGPPIRNDGLELPRSNHC